MSLELQHTIWLIRELDAEVAEIEAEIKSMMDEIPFHHPWYWLPHMGAMILAYAGMSPSTCQSGQLKNCYPHMEKRGSRYLRYALFNATSMSASRIRSLLLI